MLRRRGGRIVDEVVIPKGLEGDFVLGFRWAPLRPLFLVLLAAAADRMPVLQVGL